jgi:hypothetical protein
MKSNNHTFTKLIFTNLLRVNEYRFIDFSFRTKHFALSHTFRSLRAIAVVVPFSLKTAIMDNNDKKLLKKMKFEPHLETKVGTL